MEFPLLQFVPIAFHVFTNHHWEYSTFFTPQMGYLLLSDKITPEPSLLQAAYSQLSQSLSICQIHQSLLRSSALLCSLAYPYVSRAFDPRLNSALQIWLSRAEQRRIISLDQLVMPFIMQPNMLLFFYWPNHWWLMTTSDLQDTQLSLQTCILASWSPVCAFMLLISLQVRGHEISLLFNFMHFVLFLQFVKVQLSGSTYLMHEICWGCTSILSPKSLTKTINSTGHSIEHCITNDLQLHSALLTITH